MRFPTRALVVISGLVALCVSGIATRGLCDSAVERSSVLDLLFDARITSMAGAFAGLADDEGALFQNCAGLGQLDHPRVFTSGEVALDYHRMAVSGFATRSFALAVALMEFGPVTTWNDQGIVTGTMDYQEAAVVAGSRLIEGCIGSLGMWSLGASVRLLREGAADGDYGGFAATGGLSILLTGGIGTELPSPVMKWGVGLVVDNIVASEVVWQSGEREVLAPRVDLGIALQLADSLCLTADLVNASETRLGLEWVGMNVVRLRAGIRVADTIGWAIGAGARSGSLQVDYAYSNREYTNGQHQVSVTYSF